eukprot:scaffold42262_cov49-Phaeocystis_antarctica.AAC.2
MGTRPRRCESISSWIMLVLFRMKTCWEEEETVVVVMKEAVVMEVVGEVEEVEEVEEEEEEAVEETHLLDGHGGNLGEEDAAEGVGDGRVDADHVEHHLLRVQRLDVDLEVARESLHRERVVDARAVVGASVLHRARVSRRVLVDRHSRPLLLHVGWQRAAVRGVLHADAAPPGRSPQKSSGGGKRVTALLAVSHRVYRIRVTRSSYCKTLRLYERSLAQA